MSTWLVVSLTLGASLIGGVLGAGWIIGTVRHFFRELLGLHDGSADV